MAEKEIWVIAETRNGKLTTSTFQLLGAARQLAEDNDFKVVAVLIGSNQANGQQLAQKAPLVLGLEGSNLDQYEANRHLHALWQLIGLRGRPSIILSGSSMVGMELLPRLAKRCNSAYASYCVDIWWDGSNLTVRRPIHGGKVYEELVILDFPAICSVRPGSFPVPKDLSKPGSIEKMAIEVPSDLGLRLVEIRKISAGKKDLSEARCVVAGGRGMASPGNFKLLEELADVLDGAVGVSRAVVDSGWRHHDEQVGKSGKTISPELYIACGISGAIHHVLGMNTSKVVVAVNRDPDSAIFANADYGIVGDVIEVIPALTKALKTWQK